MPTRRRKPPNARQRVVNCIRLLVGTLAHSARSVQRASRMTNAQLFLLRELFRQDGQTINQLAERAMTKQSATSLLVSRLEAAGYVRRARSQRDRRQIEVTITPTGRRMARGAPEAPLERVLTALEHVSTRDLQALQRGLERLLDEMGVTAKTAPPLFERDV